MTGFLHFGMWTKFWRAWHRKAGEDLAEVKGRKSEKDVPGWDLNFPEKKR